MEPLSITTGCVGLISGIANLSMHIALFVSEVRSARKDMDAVQRELASLSLCLEALRIDCSSRRVDYPEAIRENLAQALINCDVITQQIKELLNKLSSGRLGRRIQWSFNSRDDMAKLRSGLEAHKSSIEIALTVGSIQMLCQVKRNQHAISRATTSIEDHLLTLTVQTVNIEENVGLLPQIAMELTSLRHQIAKLNQSPHGITSTLQNFVKASEDHTDTLLEPFAKEMSRLDGQEIERCYLENLATPTSLSNVNSNTTSKIFVSKATQTDPPVSSRRGSALSQGSSSPINVPRKPVSNHREPTSGSLSRMDSSETLISVVSESLTPTRAQTGNSSPFRPSTEILTQAAKATAFKDPKAIDANARASSKLSPTDRLRLNSRFLQVFSRTTGRDSACTHTELSCPHLREINQLFHEGADINFASKSTGVTALAAELGHSQKRLPIVVFLLSRGASTDDARLLGDAIRHNQGDIARLLLEYGADVDGYDARTYGTPLTIAVQRKNADIVKLLLDYGAKVDVAAPFRGIPLVTAATDNRAGIVKLLLDHGAEVDVEVDMQFRTALTAAAARGATQIVKLLLDYGAEIDKSVGGKPNALALAAGNGVASTVELLLDYGADINYGWPGVTALYRAASRDQRDIFQILMRRGALVRMKDGSAQPAYVLFGDRDWLGSRSGKDFVLLKMAEGLASHQPPQGRLVQASQQTECRNM